jgi:hypothetical protein
VTARRIFTDKEEQELSEFIRSAFICPRRIFADRCFQVYRATEVPDVAVGSGIELHFLPPGITDPLQPLDRYVFWSLKSACRKLLHFYCIDHPMGDIDRRLTVQFLKEAWENLSITVLQRAWTIPTDDFEDRDEEWDELEKSGKESPGENPCEQSGWTLSVDSDSYDRPISPKPLEREKTSWMFIGRR